jgi:hypothetical protein
MDVFNEIEQQFIQTYGLAHFNLIWRYIEENDIMEFYQKGRKTPEDLLYFGFHYGLVSIVAFCYCKLKVPIDLHGVLSKDFQIVGSADLDVETNSNNQAMFSSGVPIESNPGAKEGMVISTWDKFSLKRTKCFEFLCRMKNFSSYKVEKNNKGKNVFMYTIVDKYVEGYKLLDVTF